ncbi:HTH-type transcriptional regulator CysB [Rubripirellula tenax]|uniref:HTH-type transcriptional regulator CysB n=1 Tax=Rubripirellula tenax TaxID=2528015 RepID=A0A5C6F968_9BACT|nr:LysR family transcriptional regulator [Rubripirellula tenax]TWU56984.1 HTH-type transcriptional regulator CysB [Rubripirellula tenax]
MKISPPRGRVEDLSVSHLHTFRLVMQHGGYASAAKASGMSVPSVWQHIRSLESIYAVKLFEKVGRQVQPTDSAKRLFDQVDQVLVHLESTFDHVDNSQAERLIRLVVGTRMMMEDLALPLAAFRKRHRNQLVIRQGNEQRAEERLLADETDIALTLEPGPYQRSPRIHYERAYTVDFLAIAARKHAFAKSGTSSLRELVKHELVVTTVGTHGRDTLEQALHRDGLSATIAIETDNSAFTIACVAAGMGVGVLAGRGKGTLCKNLLSRSLTKQLGQRNIVFMWRKGTLLSRPMLDFVDHVRRLDADWNASNP